MVVRCTNRCLFFLLIDSLLLILLLFLLNFFMVGDDSYFVGRRRKDSFVDHNQFHLSSLQVAEKRSRASTSVVAAAIDGKDEAASVGDVSVDSRQCTMGTCFDFSRCGGPRGFKVYVYPKEKGSQMSDLYSNILYAIKSSPYITMNPEEACLFVPSFDTLDRDEHSSDFVKNLPSFASLPYWNGGRNHLIFVQYSGTWPDYSELLGFPAGQAILARASMNIRVYRSGFDISLPLMHKEHPSISSRHSGLLSIVSKPGLMPLKRKYLLVFKGKRYLYGQGSRIRSSLYHLHNGRDIILLTTCKHNQDWIKYTDDRCDTDNELFDKFEYEDLMSNSSFCLVPRGRRLGSFRFLEALQASCIPVSLSNGYVLPFSEVLDWNKAAFVINEKQLLQLPYILRRVSSAKVLSLRLYTQFMWDTYFSSVRKIILTTLEIIRSRIEPQPLAMWNRPPGHLQIHQSFSSYPSDYPFADSLVQHSAGLPDMGLTTTQFTAVVTVTRPALRNSSPLLQLLQVLLQSPRLEAVVLMWAGPGPPQIQVTLSRLKRPVRIVSVNLEGRHTKSLWPSTTINTSAVLHLYEDSVILSEEVEFGFSVWQAFPSRLVGYFSHTHSWDDIRQQWAYSSQLGNYVSMVSMDTVFYHRYYGYIMTNFLEPKLRELADQSAACLTIIFNCVVAQHSLSPPLKLPCNRPSAPSVDKTGNTPQQRAACLNMAVNAFGHMPLMYSKVRLDPVLYKDNVSMYRKEYRKMEVS